MLWDILENIRVALDGLLSNKLRSGLTMLGVIIGVAAVIALLSIGAGAQASITNQINSAGTNLLFVMPGAPRNGNVRGAFGGAVTLTYKDAQAIADPANVPDAKSVAPEFSRNAQVIFSHANLNTSIKGVTDSYQAVFGLQVEQGRFVTPKDVSTRSTIAILGSQVAQDLFGDVNPVGQKIKVSLPKKGHVSLTIVGVLAKKGNALMGSPDDAVFVPISTAQWKLFPGHNPRGDLLVSRVNVMAASKEKTDAVAGELDALLRARHNLAPDVEADFRVLNQADLLNMATQVTGTLTVFLGAIAGIALLVGGIGIMNIMLVSVTERTREIGVRKAVGALTSDILLQFLMEAVVLSLLGGLIGILLGVVLAKLVDLSGTMSAVVTPTSILLAVGFSLAVGLFFGIYPAKQAAQLNPIDALRYE